MITVDLDIRWDVHSVNQKFPKMWIKASMGQGLYLFGMLNFKYDLYALMDGMVAAPGLKAFLAGAFCWASQGPGFTDSNRWFGVVNHRESIDLRYLKICLNRKGLS